VVEAGPHPRRSDERAPGAGEGPEKEGIAIYVLLAAMFVAFGIGLVLMFRPPREREQDPEIKERE